MHDWNYSRLLFVVVSITTVGYGDVTVRSLLSLIAISWLAAEVSWEPRFAILLRCGGPALRGDCGWTGGAQNLRADKHEGAGRRVRFETIGTYWDWRKCHLLILSDRFILQKCRYVFHRFRWLLPLLFWFVILIICMWFVVTYLTLRHPHLSSDALRCHQSQCDPTQHHNIVSSQCNHLGFRCMLTHIIAFYWYLGGLLLQLGIHCNGWLRRFYSCMAFWIKITALWFCFVTF